MTRKWILGSLRDGTVTETNLPTAAGSTMFRDILLDGEANVDVIVTGTPFADTWIDVFEEGQTYLAYIDDVTADVLYFGVLISRKLSNKLGKLALKVREPAELLRSRFVIGGSGKITAPDAGRTFMAATAGGAMAEMIKFWASSSDLPESSPKPPAILGTVQETAGVAFTHKVLYADRLTVQEALEALSEDRTTSGTEWRSTPRFTDSSQSRIVLDWTFGTNAVPKIGYDQNVTFDLSDESPDRTKLSAFEPKVSSEGYYNRIWGQSKAGGSTTDIDLTPLTISGSDKVLIEHYWAAGVELTEAQMMEHLTARLNVAQAGEIAMTVHVEEVEDPKMWIDRLGFRVNVIGRLSSERFVMRIASVGFNDKGKTVLLELAAPTVKLPRLPSHANRNIVTKPGSEPNSPALKFTAGGGTGGGGLSPWNPGEPGGDGGGTGIDWGTGGGMPDEFPEWADASSWKARFGSVLDPAFNQGGYCQNNGNVVFSTGALSWTVNLLSQQLMAPVVSPSEIGTLETIVTSGYLQDGQILGVRLDNKMEITAPVVNQLLQSAGAKGVWSQPFSALYEPFYVSYLSLDTYSEAMVAIGMNVYMPVNFTLGWNSTDLGEQTQFFNGWIMSTFDKDTLALGPWIHMPGEFEQTGHIRVSARAGSWMIVTDPNGSIRARNVGDSPGYGEWKSFPPIPFMENTQKSADIAIANGWGEGGGDRYAFAAVRQNGFGNTSQPTELWAIQLFSAEGSAPLPLIEADWVYLTETSSYPGDNVVFSHAARMFHGAAEIKTLDEIGSFVPVEVEYGSLSQFSQSGRVLSYRDWIYLKNTPEGDPDQRRMVSMRIWEEPPPEEPPAEEPPVEESP